MPQKFDKMRIPKKVGYDRRYKLTPEQRVEIIKLMGTQSETQTAIDFNVSRKLISFIRYPEKLKESKKQYKERQKDGRYYNKEKHTIYMRTHRQHKKNLLSLNKLNE